MMDSKKKDIKEDLLLKKAIETNPAPAFILNAQQQVVAWNAACERLTGVPASSVIGTRDAWRGFYISLRRTLANRLLESHNRGNFFPTNKSIPIPEQQDQGIKEGLFPSLNGKDRYLIIKAEIIRDDDGEILGCIETLFEVTDYKIYQRQFAFSNTHETITGLPNRQLLEERLLQSLFLAKRNIDFLAVFWIRIEEFNNISLYLSDAAMSTTLTTLSRRLLFEVRAIDTVAYCGNGEFVVVASKFRHEEYIADLAYRIHSSITTLVEQKTNKTLALKCFVGISVFPQNGNEVEILLTKAREASFLKKGHLLDSVCFYDDHLNEKYLMRLNIESQLKHAISKNEFFVHYQPKVSLFSGKMTGMEALLRWETPSLGSIRPDIFIPLAETLGLIDSIGNWVFKTVCEQYRDWQNKQLSPPPISVNLSGQQLRNDTFVQFAKKTLQQTGIRAQCIELEVTETSMMGNLESARDTLATLREIGFCISLDDFGTGYSSLNYLRWLPIDKIKIDRSFVLEVTSDPNSAAIITATEAMAHALGLQVIAEGVETEEQLHFLRRLKCEEIQGYLYSRPLPAGELEVFLKNPPCLPVNVAEEPFLKRVLIVDDNPEVLSTLKQTLLLYGYEVETALNPDQGFSIMAQKNIPVLIADQIMDDLDGARFLERVKKLYPKTIRIAFTGSDNINLMMDAVNKGAVYKFFLKPWEIENVVSIIEDAFCQYCSSLSN